MKKTAVTAVMLLSMLGSTVATSSAASAAPAKKCPSENFQLVNGQCVSDGKAEHLR